MIWGFCSWRSSLSVMRPPMSGIRSENFPKSRGVVGNLSENRIKKRGQGNNRLVPCRRCQGWMVSIHPLWDRARGRYMRCCEAITNPRRFGRLRESNTLRGICRYYNNLRLPDLGGNWNGTFYAVSQRYRPAAEYQPGYDGLPVGGTRVPPNTRSCESQGEWRSHSSGRRVVAASVLVSRRLAHDAGSRMKKCQVTFRKTPSKPARGQEV